ncbi:MAG: hypothetical protein HYV47_02280 [Candidatus Nealsonbacteria bacterium]|nr:hypothetical protein [Candidatus Nealsonbacteria bacterium]
MRIVLKFSGNMYNLMRQAGYHPHETGEEKSGESSFARRLSIADYPRFHAYVELSGQELIINLHLDQKKPIYRGTSAHSGEYDGTLLEKEAERIKQIAGL